MRKYALLLVCIAICSLQVVFAQSRIITGSVSDAEDWSTYLSGQKGLATRNAKNFSNGQV